MSNEYELVALLPIKANSERVPGKNFKNFGGKPLFMWILEKLLAVNEIEAIIINTDAENLLKVNGLPDSNKIILRNRKKEICGDDISMNLVLQDDLKNINSKYFLMTHTTNPFLNKETILQALSTFKQAIKTGSHDSLFTVNKIQERFYDKDLVPINHDPLNLIKTQDIPEWYSENSNLYLFTKESFLKNNSRIGTYPKMLSTSKLESLDIDTPEDWELAEAVLEYFKNRDI